MPVGKNKTLKGPARAGPKKHSKPKISSSASPTQLPPTKYFELEKGAVEHADEVFTALMGLPFEYETGLRPFGKGEFRKMKRQTCAISFTKNTRTGAENTYIYSGQEREHLWHEDPVLGPAGPILTGLAREAERRTGVKYDTGIVTKYLAPSKKDKNDKGDLSFHSDSGANFPRNGAVACFVFGRSDTPRPLLFRRRGNTSVIGEWVARPDHGDFYVMKPGCQEALQHAIKKGEPGSAPRISVTLRPVR